MTDFRPSRFQILPTAIKNLIIINVLVFAAQYVLQKQGINLEDTFALHTWQSPLFKPWQLITHLFMHASWDHIFFNMFALWMFGSVLENVWGPKRMLVFYLVCGLGAALCHMMVLYFEGQQLINEFSTLNLLSPDFNSRLTAFIDNHNIIRSEGSYSLEFAHTVLYDNLNEPTLGASGAVFGCLAAFGYLFPNDYIYVYFFLPLKAKWFVLLYAGFELYSTVHASAGDNIAHVAHLGGALTGFLMVYFWNKTKRRTF